MKEAHSKMRNNREIDELFKKRFTAERSRQFDILQAKEATFLRADGFSERASELTKPGWKKIELVHQRAQRNGEKVNVKLKHVKEHDSTLFQFNRPNA